MELNYNRVELRGVAEDAPLLSHVNHGCAFYRFTLSVLRLSGQADKLPVIVPRPLLLLTPVSPGDGVHITGQLRSFNNKSGQGSRLVISTFAQTLTHDAGEPLNRIFLSGVLCKQPALRRTPLGREICDMILAVNRRYGRADYLPCIAWGAVAQQVSLLHTGARLTAEGRVQSRVYSKTASPPTAPPMRCPSCVRRTGRNSRNDALPPSIPAHSAALSAPKNRHSPCCAPAGIMVKFL